MHNGQASKLQAFPFFRRLGETWAAARSRAPDTCIRIPAARQRCCGAPCSSNACKARMQREVSRRNHLIGPRLTVLDESQDQISRLLRAIPCRNLSAHCDTLCPRQGNWLCFSSITVNFGPFKLFMRLTSLCARALQHQGRAAAHRAPCG